MNGTLTAIQWFTDFGDQGVVLPGSAAVLCVLLLARWWPGALWWALATGGVLGLMLVLKLGVGACGWELGVPGLNSPSGHTASATMFYGGVTSIVLAGRRSLPKVLSAILPAILIALLFAASRVALHDHSVLEVAIGGLVGFCGVASFAGLCGPVPVGLGRTRLCITVAVVAMVAHGHRMAAEQHIHSFATLRLRALLCPEPR